MKGFARVAAVVVVAGIALSCGRVDSRADCAFIDQPTFNSAPKAYAPNQRLGQSFVACQTGSITRIILSVTDNPNLLELELQPGAVLGSPTYVQRVPTGIVPHDIVLDRPFPVVQGGLYSFSLRPTNGVTGPLGLYANTNNRYSEGTHLFFDGSTTVPQSGDLRFVVRFSPDVPVPADRSTWGATKALYR